ncbi:hypothetical protein [uncultured Paraglaciecola sp.]|uniref:hypothetical protein n=1 Tax=uncultured Paraglaciecola sp. TaxID=1765024 RepID=UPI002609FF84|nr:hypothetical protein [uncultured Paraglaciecola sp.]
MPAPLLWLGAGVIAMLAGTKYSNGKKLEQSVSRLPGNSDEKVKPINGAVVTCGIYGLFEHTGIWVDGNILELKGNGLIRGISPNRFLQERSGDEIYVACGGNNTPLIQAGTADRAVSQLFSYSEYDVIKNNCHKFVWQCISGESNPLTRFSELNQKLAERFDTTIHWHPIDE